MARIPLRRRLAGALLLFAAALGIAATSVAAAVSSYAPEGYGFHQNALLALGALTLLATIVALVGATPWAAAGALLVVAASLGLTAAGAWTTFDFALVELGVAAAAGIAAAVLWRR